MSAAQPVDPRTAQLVTLPQASTRLGKPAHYFTTRRTKYRDHHDEVLRFPLPLITAGGAGVYDLATLLVWNERRITRDQERRAAWEQARVAKTEAKESTP